MADIVLFWILTFQIYIVCQDYLIYHVILSETYQMLWQMISDWSQPNLIDDKLKRIAA